MDKILLILLVTLSASSCKSESGYFIPPSAPASLLPALVSLPQAVRPDLLAANASEKTPLPVVPIEATPLLNSSGQNDPGRGNDPLATQAPDSASQPTPELSLPSATPTPFATSEPTPTSTPVLAERGPVLYYAQAADTLPVVAVRFGVAPSEITSPEPLPEREFIDPGQLMIIPDLLDNTTSSEKLMPDSEVVYSPSATDFDIAAYIGQAGGALRTYSQWLKSTGVISGAEVVKRVAIENSINPRLLLSLLEYQGGWVTGQPQGQEFIDYPMGYQDEGSKGLYDQLVWAVNHLSTGYYAYREGRLTEIQFPDGSSARLAPDLNAGSAAIQYFFAQIYQGQDWLNAIDPENGFPALHAQMFGSPWERAEAVEPLFPPGASQPPFSLPFVRGFPWSHTGGPHGAWEHEGAYAALDFAPGSAEPGCVDSNAWVLASASGLVVRSGNGVVVIDLDGDGREQTGWVLLYLHVSNNKRVPTGTWVDADDKLGHPSCEGGISTGTHVHIARKFNGEWIPADGPLPFNLGGWLSHAGSEAYKGTLTRDGQTITSCTCSNAESVVIRGPDDP